MSIFDASLIIVAGFAAGATNAVIGWGTLITFPTLVALGYPPVTATMSNAVGLVAGSVSGTWGYRRELSGQWDRLRWQIPAMLIAALILVVLGARIQAWARHRAEAAGRSADHVSPRRMAALVAATFVIAVYGGYFTAAQGVLLVGAMGALLPESIQRMNAAKNLTTLLVNVVAAVAYTLVAFHRISWPTAGLIAAGSLIGGWAGARYGRRLSPTTLRAAIVVVGLTGIYRLLTV